MIDPAIDRAMLRATGLHTVACAALVGFAAPASALQVRGPHQKPRVAVMDLSGSALRMQTTVMPGQPVPIAPQYPTPGSQTTTVTVAIPPPSEFARGLTEMLTSILVSTDRFIVLERAAMQQIDHEQSLGPEGRAQNRRVEVVKQ
jgi:curli biogenesis system outer membrane secretion channel CsgG